MKDSDSILIVDDRPENLVALETALKPLGIGVVKASSGEQALRAILRHCFVLAIVDARMPGMDGYELAELMRAHPQTRDLPIIFLTAGGYDEKNVSKAYRSGAVDFLCKPLNQDALLAKAGVFLELYRQRRTLGEKVAELLAVKTELERANRMLTEMSFIDGLTGIRNRRYFDEVLAREWKRAAREGHAVSVIMADIDGFKAYNDLHGHLEGDECLRAIAKALSRAVRRPGDLVARYGGEEFAAVLPDTREQGAGAIAVEMLAQVHAAAIPHGCSVVKGVNVVTVSLGVATALPTDTDLPEIVLEAADKALYEAKRSGRNRIAPGHRPEDCEVAEAVAR